MKRLFAVLVLLVAACATPVSVPVKPFDTVRSLKDKDGDIMCSAVVIAPGRAVTAKHCLEDVMQVDDVPVQNIALFEGYDIAEMYAPGLACPCATIGKPQIGDKAVTIGFPMGGPKRVTNPFEIKFIGVMVDFAPWILSPEVLALNIVASHDSVLIPGDSGGGLFVGDKLVGTNSGMVLMPPFGMPFGDFFTPIPDALAK